MHILELIKFEINDSKQRSSAYIKLSRLTMKSHIRTDISYLGAILYNQLSKELKEMKSLNRFKIPVKRYLFERLTFF